MNNNGVFPILNTCTQLFVNILSWNIEGLHKYQDDGELKQYLSKFDIVFLCETWSYYVGKFGNFLNSYTLFDCVQKKRTGTGRNSGGICVFIKEWLVRNNLVKRIFSNFKDCFVFHFKGSLFDGMQDVILYFAYASPQGSRIYNNLDENNGILLIENNLNEIKIEYPDCSFFLAGDLNARTKDFKDFIPRDDLQYVFGETEYEKDNFDMHRNNKDSEVFNQFGQSLVDLCCTLNIHIINGRLYDDTNGNYTCTANDGTSVVDYNVASSELFARISYFNVENRDESVHFPLYCQFHFTSDNAVTQADSEPPHIPKPTVRMRWNNDYKDQFLQRFRERLVNLREELFRNISESIDNSVEMITSVYTGAATSMTKRSKPREPYKQPPWWDLECDTLKQRKYSMLRKFRSSNANCDFLSYKQARNQFKHRFKFKKRQYQKDRRQELYEARTEPRKFWQMIKLQIVQKKPQKSATQNGEITLVLYYTATTLQPLRR